MRYIDAQHEIDNESFAKLSILVTSEGPLLEGWKEGLTLFDVNRNLLSLLLPSFRSINRRDGSNRVIISSGGLSWSRVMIG